MICFDSQVSKYMLAHMKLLLASIKVATIDYTSTVSSNSFNLHASRYLTENNQPYPLLFTIKVPTLYQVEYQHSVNYISSSLQCFILYKVHT